MSDIHGLTEADDHKDHHLPSLTLPGRLCYTADPSPHTEETADAPLF